MWVKSGRTIFGVLKPGLVMALKVIKITICLARDLGPIVTIVTLSIELLGR